MAEPCVSVLLSVRDGEAHLGEALASLRAQTFADFEVVAIDDGSRDRSAALIEEAARQDARFRIVRHGACVGLTVSLNEAAALARGRYLARQDADDVSEPERLACQLAAFEADPELALLGTAYRVIDAHGRALETLRAPQSTSEIRWTMLFHNAFCHSSVMLRRSALEPGRSLYDPTLPFAQDYECWSRLLARGRCANLPRPLVGFRAHPAQLSVQRRAEQQECARRISARALQALEPGITLAQVDRLRALAQDPTVLPSLAEWRLMARLLSRLAAQPGMDPAVVRRIRWRQHASFAARPLRRRWRARSPRPARTDP